MRHPLLTASQEDKLPPFSIQHPYDPVPLPTPFPETQLKRHAVASLLSDLFRTFISVWLYGPHWQASERPYLQRSASNDQTQKLVQWCTLVQWSTDLKSYFNDDYLRKLDKISGDSGRFAFLQTFEFTLFERVKKLIADEGSGQKQGIQVAIEKITQASLPCTSHACTANALQLACQLTLH